MFVLVLTAAGQILTIGMRHQKGRAMPVPFAQVQIDFSPILSAIKKNCDFSSLSEDVGRVIKSINEMTLAQLQTKCSDWLPFAGNLVLFSLFPFPRFVRTHSRTQESASGLHSHATCLEGPQSCTWAEAPHSLTLSPGV